ncbi:nuclear transport factor 2 family protein [Nocardia aobensis]|uniref:Nuclear transport factor 2 family protein n=1 Tax=Nocardia aobensis TaxID=257277 RepID=A0ABW6PER7_9NOCA|nr:nuclear transport factor 2 family protein [Nocardia elegans]MBF6451084.1 nuclear transport factor 2 family protein [Nocardia elegans]
MSESTTDNQSLVRQFLTALALLDVPAISARVADDITWKVPGSLPISGVYDGKPAFVDGFLHGAAELFEAGSLNFDVQHLFAVGEIVVAEYVGTAKSARTGKSYRNEYCVIFGFRNGRISLVREYLDTAHVADVLLAADPN